MYIGGGGGPDPMVEALNEYKQAMQPKISVPVENYLGAAHNQETYQAAMKQYQQRAGKTPGWFTNDYEHDKPFIETAIAATMSPKDQMIRKEAEQKIAQGDTKLKKWEDFKREQQRLKDREITAKIEGGEAKKSVVPTDKEKVIVGELLKASEAYPNIDPKSIQAITDMAASRVKFRMIKEKGDFSEMVREELDDIMDTLVQGQGSMFGLMPGKKKLPGGDKPAVDKSSGAPPAKSTKPPGVPAAPAGAIDYLRQHPEAKEQFRQKYGYLPE